MTSRRHVIAGLAALPLLGAMPLRRALAEEAPDVIASSAGDIIIHPVNHASLALTWGEHVVYADPVGGRARFEHLPRPTAILITHAHGDHFDAATLRDIVTDSTAILASDQVFKQLPEALRARAVSAGNGEVVAFSGVSVDVVPAYNITKSRLGYHPKGIGNGYVLNIGDKRIYIAGDTEGTEEMRALSGIDVAFLPMNIPYTMDIEQAADAIKAFRPKVVYPYHFQAMKVENLQGLVGEAAEVRLRTWY